MPFMQRLREENRGFRKVLRPVAGGGALVPMTKAQSKAGGFSKRLQKIAPPMNLNQQRRLSEELAGNYGSFHNARRAFSEMEEMAGKYGGFTPRPGAAGAGWRRIGDGTKENPFRYDIPPQRTVDGRRKW